MAPVWEANHVWLIFVLVVVWTAYPVGVRLDRVDALRAAASWPAIGIIFRGATYALRSGTRTPRARPAGRHRLRGLLDPDAVLRSAPSIGAIASGRVPVGNAAGDLFTSWLNATSIFDRRRSRSQLRAISPPSTSPPTPPAAAMSLVAAVPRPRADRRRPRRRRRARRPAVLHSDAHRSTTACSTATAWPRLIVSVLAGVGDAGARLAQPLRARALHRGGRGRRDHRRVGARAAARAAARARRSGRRRRRTTRSSS